MMFWGVVSGLAAAAVQDTGYVLARLDVKRGGTPFGLLAGTQCWMGGMSLILLAFLFPFKITETGLFPLHLCGAAFGSLFGQLFFFRAEEDVEPSRIASLMGLRTVLAAAALFLFAGERYNALQCLGILLALFSAFYMNGSPAGGSWKGMDKMGMALLCYLFSDLSIMPLVREIRSITFFHSALAAACMVNVLLGCVMIPWYRKAGKEAIRHAGPFAVTWFLKQVLIYSCYGLIGPVFGNVVLNMRGPMEMGVAPMFRKMGWKELEPPLPSAVRRRRLYASGMMLFAVILYAFG